MNIKGLSFLKNTSYLLSTNLISLIISTLVILIVPKMIGVEEYGYWQLFIFYSSYVGFLNFGWNDGIYLRYGGKEYKDINKELFFSQFFMVVILQIIMAVLIMSILVSVKDPDRFFIFNMVVVNMIIINVRSILLFTLQATNKIKRYATILLLSRVLYCIFIILFLSVGFAEYKLLVIAEIFGNLISLFYAIYICRSIVVRKISIFYFSFNEAIQNISVGIKLMVANIASLLILGVVRFGIERTWDVATFGKVSLILSVSGLVMIFINAFGVVFFPLLRKLNHNSLSDVYKTMRTILMLTLFGILITYYPLKVILSLWLPKYNDSLVYLSMLFPILIFEGKTVLLINTFLKTLRKEKIMLKINLISLVISITFTFASTILIKDLNLAILSIIIILAVKSIIAEVWLSIIMHVPVYKDIALEILLTSIFIIIGWFVNSWVTATCYICFYLLYILIKRKDITLSIHKIRAIITN